MRRAGSTFRTGRAGKAGVALTIVTRADQKSIAEIEKLIVRKIDWQEGAEMPSGDEAEAPGCLAGNRCLTHDLWSELGEQIRLFLANVTLADICAGHVAGRAACPLPPGLTEAAE